MISYNGKTINKGSDSFISRNQSRADQKPGRSKRLLFDLLNLQLMPMRHGFLD